MGVATYLVRIISLWAKGIKHVNRGGRQKDLYPSEVVSLISPN